MAVYSPASGASYLASMSPAVMVTVGKVTTTVVSVSASTATAGQPELLTAVVSVQSPGTGVATGMVTFEDGGAVLGTAELAVVNNQDTATLTTSALALGPHSITAVYGGDMSNQSSTSTQVDFVVQSTDQNLTQVDLTVLPAC